MVRTKGDRKLESLDLYLPGEDQDYLRVTQVIDAESLDTEGRITVAAPSARFRVEVRADGFERLELGPFDPSNLPDPLVIELTAVPGVRGAVVFDGAPVEGAEVTLHDAVLDGEMRIDDFLCRSENTAKVRGETDGMGRFDLGLAETDTFYLRVVKDGFAPAELGPFDLDHRKGRKGILVNLTPGGILEVRVLLPEGRDGAGVIVGISRGDGFARTRRAGTGGVVRFERLTPGPWYVEKRDEELGLAGSSSSHTGGFFAKPPIMPFSCEVREGRTTVYYLDLTEGSSCVVEGSLLVNGAVPKGWSAWLSEKQAGNMILRANERVPLDLEGRFRVALARPCTAYLFVTGSPEEGAYLRIREMIDLSRGVVPWSHDLVTGRVRLRGADRYNEPGAMVVYAWEEGKTLSVYTDVDTKKHGEQVLVVPAGRGKIIRAQPDLSSPEMFRQDALAEIDVPAGGEVEIDL